MSDTLDMNTVTRRYVFKLYPTAEQAAALHEQRMMCADLWNALLQRREDVWRRERRTLTRFDLEYEITALYAECPEWRALSTWTARRVNVALARAFDGFFRRLKAGTVGSQAGYPRYKRRRDGDSIPHRCASGCRLTPRERSGDGASAGSARNWCLRLKGVDGTIHARGIFPAVPLRHLDADVLWRDGRWWFSLCVEMTPRRQAGSCFASIRLGAIDGLAEVNGRIETPPELHAAREIEAVVDRLKAERDLRWPRRAPADTDWRDATAEIACLAAFAARKRRNALHVWTARTIASCGDLTIIMPAVKDGTATARGDERSWGAAVEVVSAINRETLSRAPATAAAMLEYKAAEAGIRCDVIADAAPDLAVSAKLADTGKALRRTRRALATAGKTRVAA